MITINDHAEILINVLGEDLYSHVLNTFKQMILSDYEIISFMARKCYCLFNTFKAILNTESEIKNKLNQKTITHNKNIFLLNDARLKDKKILVVDDTMIYGSTVRDFIYELNMSCNINTDNIGVCILAYSDNCLNRDNVAFYNDKKLTFNYNTEEIKEWNVSTFGEVKFFKLQIIRRYSAYFVDAIHALNIPYTAFSMSFECNLSNCGLFKTDCDKNQKKFTR